MHRKDAKGKPGVIPQRILSLVPERFRQFFLYALCGGSGVTFDFLLYVALVTSGVGYQFANLLGYAGGTILSFLLNRVITFGVLDAPLLRFAGFLTVAGIGYVCSAAVLWVMIDRYSVNEIASKICAIIVVVVVQYTLNARFTFRRAK